MMLKKSVRLSLPVVLSMLFLCVADGVVAAPQYENPAPTSSLPTAGPGFDLGTLPIIPAYYTKVRIAHAVLASAAWLGFFPMGSILIRTLETSRSIQIHYTVQMVGYYIFIAAAGMGIWMAKTVDVLDRYHPVIGMVLLGCLAVQPVTELLNHFLYGRWPNIRYIGHVHIWFGRLLITVGIIQGGLGLVFSASLPMAKSEPAPRIAYGIVAVVVWVLYISLAIVWPEVKQTLGWWRRRHGGAGEEGLGLRNRSLADLAAPSAIERPNGGRK